MKGYSVQTISPSGLYKTGTIDFCQDKLETKQLIYSQGNFRKATHKEIQELNRNQILQSLSYLQKLVKNYLS